MLIELVEQTPIEVQVEDVAFVFRAYTQQDIIYATAIIQQGGLSALSVIDRDTITKHVFNALSEIKGEIKIAGSEDGALTIEQLKGYANGGKIQGVFAREIMMPWALKILEAHGFFKKELPKKEVAPKKKKSAES